MVDISHYHKLLISSLFPLVAATESLKEDEGKQLEQFVKGQTLVLAYDKRPYSDRQCWGIIGLFVDRAHAAYFLKPCIVITNTGMIDIYPDNLLTANDYRFIPIPLSESGRDVRKILRNLREELEERETEKRYREAEGGLKRLDLQLQELELTPAVQRYNKLKEEREEASVEVNLLSSAQRKEKQLREVLSDYLK